jgi:hypothetical protein
MTATDFNLSKDIQFSPDTGITTFRDSRLVLFDANAVGLLRQQMVESMRLQKARELFLRFGYQNGFADFLQMKLNYSFNSEMDLLASGPVLHTWEGIVKATPNRIEFDRAKGTFLFGGVWLNSYEAEQYLSFNEQSDEPVCWSLMGYASGWCTAFFGAPLVAYETMCMGKGDDHCEWIIQPPGKHGPEAAPIVAALKPLQGGR